MHIVCICTLHTHFVAFATKMILIQPVKKLLKQPQVFSNVFHLWLTLEHCYCGISVIVGTVIQIFRVIYVFTW